MRIVKEIDRGLLKITVFKMNDKFSIKFEKNLNELIIKFRDGSSIEDSTSLDRYLNEANIQQYERSLDEINEVKTQQMVLLEAESGTVFPVII